MQVVCDIPLTLQGARRLGGGPRGGGHRFRERDFVPGPRPGFLRHCHHQDRHQILVLVKRHPDPRSQTEAQKFISELGETGVRGDIFDHERLTDRVLIGLQNRIVTGRSIIADQRGGAVDAPLVLDP